MISRFYLSKLLLNNTICKPNCKLPFNNSPTMPAVSLFYDNEHGILNMYDSSKPTPLLKQVGHLIPFVPSSIEPVAASQFGLASGLLLKVKNKYLVIQRSSNSPVYGDRLAFPTGYVMANETLEDAARRETEEEVGIGTYQLKLVPEVVFESVPNPNIHNIFVLFSADMNLLNNMEPVIRVDKNEVSRVTFMDINEIKNNIDKFPPGLQLYINTK